MLTAEEKTNITKGFAAAGEKISKVEADTTTAIEETQQQVKAVQNQFRAYGKALMARSVADGEYHGFWRDDGQAKEFGDIVMACMRGGQKDMGTGTQAGGGALVPDELAAWIIQKLGKYGKFRRNAVTVKLGTSKQLVPRVTTDLTIYCPGEGKEITKSDIKVDMVNLDVKKFACLTVLNRELEDDSIIGLGEIVGISITRSMAKKEDEIGFMGDGTATYFGMRGIIGALLAVDPVIANIKSLVVASGNAYSEIVLGDFRKVVGILPEDADEDARWFMSKKFYYNTVYPLAETAGVANLFEILSDRKDRFLLGYPVEFVPCMPSTEADSQICAILGDLSLGAFLGERRTLEIMRSDDVLFATDQIAIRGTERIDINAYGVGDTVDAGPICALITAAT